MKLSKRHAHFGRTRDGARWAPLDFVTRHAGNVYLEQRVCGCCGRDDSSFTWPICADLTRNMSGFLAAVAQPALHDLICARYWAGKAEWVCDDCGPRLRKET